MPYFRLSPVKDMHTRMTHVTAIIFNSSVMMDKKHFKASNFSRCEISTFRKYFADMFPVVLWP